MRIMLVVNEFPPEKIAGTAMATKSLAEHLSSNRHQVCVVVTTSCPTEKLKDIQSHDYQLIWLKPLSFRGLGWLWRIFKTLKYAKRFKPDIIQGQAVSCGLIAGVVGRIMKVPSICYAQGYDVYQASWWQRRTEIKWGCSLPNLCLAVTGQLKEKIASITDVPVSILPHAFDTIKPYLSKETLRQKHGLADGVQIVLNVARLESFKGQDVLLKAWQMCLSQQPKAVLWIAGTGSMDSELKRMVKELGIDNHVRFLGYMPQKDIHQMMEAADLFVLPSREEPFGIVLLEAMAHGLPIVASKVGGIPEVLPSQGQVWLVPSENTLALSESILESLQKHQNRSELNRKHALLFTWEEQVKRFELLYHELKKKEIG